MRTFVRVYKGLAVILLNSIVLFVLVNLILFVLYGIVDALQGAQRDDRPVGSQIYGDALLSQAYPSWTPDERDQLLHETWTRPLRCAPFVHFQESVFSGKYVNVDPAGFRWGLEKQPWPPDASAFTIFVFGGSTTFGYGIADFETIPAQMQRILSERDLDRPVQVYNFGQGFYFSSQELRLFENLLQQGYHPDMAIFIDGHNEFGSLGKPAQPARAIECSGNAAPEPAGFELPIARAVRSIQFRLGITGADDAANVATPTPDELADYRRSLETSAERIIELWKTNRQIIKAISNQFGIRTAFVWQPSSLYNYDTTYHIFRAVRPIGLNRWQVGYETMAAKKAEWQTWDDFLYLADIQVGRKELLYVDTTHYNSKLSAEIAALIVDFLLSKGFVH